MRPYHLQFLDDPSQKRLDELDERGALELESTLLEAPLDDADTGETGDGETAGGLAETSSKRRRPDRVGNTHIGCNYQLLLLRYRIPSNVSIHWTVEYLDWEMEWLSIQVIREICIPRLAEEEHPQLLFDCPTSAGQQEGSGATACLPIYEQR
ncbi:hypothetical protein V8E54_005367 [Elaphomyces granulatus]